MKEFELQLKISAVLDYEERLERGWIGHEGEWYNKVLDALMRLWYRCSVDELRLRRLLFAKRYRIALEKDAC